MNINGYTIAYLGRPGSYSFQAGQKFSTGKFKMKDCKNIPEIFDLVSNRPGFFGVVPIENTTSGSIHESYDLLISRNLKIIGEIKLRVQHALLASRLTESVKQIGACLSHEHAIRQCGNFLGMHKGIKIILTGDTASAAEMVSLSKNSGQAAIAHLSAAKIYGLKILRRNISDNRLNTTRFIMIAKNQKNTGTKISLVFTLAHRPGSLVASLKPVSDMGFNLTKIESRPIPSKPWEYLFYVDFESDRTTDFSSVGKILKNSVSFLKVLGVYEKGKRYDH